MATSQHHHHPIMRARGSGILVPQIDRIEFSTVKTPARFCTYARIRTARGSAGAKLLHQDCLVDDNYLLVRWRKQNLLRSSHMENNTNCSAKFAKSKRGGLGFSQCVPLENLLRDTRRSGVKCESLTMWSLGYFFVLLLGRSWTAAAAPSEDASSSTITLTDVQATSLLVAYWRQCETRRSTLPHASPATASLIQDAPAKALLDALATEEQLANYQASPVLAMGIDTMAIRTRTIDDWLMSGLSSSSSSSTRSSRQRQVVNLGAGMCTRPYRLDWSSKDDDDDSSAVTVYEVDDPELLQAKRTVLREAGYEPRVKVVDVAGDVTDWEHLGPALLEAGLDPSTPTDWIGEGLFEYIDPALHPVIFKETRKYGKAPGSRFFLFLGDLFSEEYVIQILGWKLPWIGYRPHMDVVKELHEAGWSQNVTVLGEHDFMRLYNRTIGIPVFLVMVEGENRISASNEEL